MISTEVLPTPSAVASHAGPFSRVARGLLLLLFAVIYAGCLEFFLKFSPVLLYGTYVVIIGCVGVCLVLDWSLTRNARSVAPYLIWTLGYFVWGMLAISSHPAVASEGLKVYIKNFLLIGSLTILLDRRTLKSFAQAIQIVAIANLGLCLWEVANPELIETIAKTRHEGATAYDVLRPAGLWSNPDEAASSFIFALLLARWAGRPLALLGCIAAVVGIYLGASRTGAYLLLICGLVLGAYRLRTWRIDSAKLAVWTGALLLIGAAATAAVIHFKIDPTENWQLARILDFTEAKASAAGGSRLHIANEAIQMTLAGPWYGHGLFAFQLFHAEGVPVVMDPPAHNIYLAVLGEAGVFVALTYLLLLGLGLLQVLRVPMLSADRITVLLMWFCYLTIGLTWHNQFTAFTGMIFIGLLWHLPAILKLPPVLRDSAPAS